MGTVVVKRVGEDDDDDDVVYVDPDEFQVP